MLDFSDDDLTNGHTAGNAPGDSEGADYVDQAITSRRSVRGFRPDPVPHALVEHLLAVARRAPSGTNMQPWRAYVVTGSVKERITQTILEIKAKDPASLGRSWKYYPDVFPEIYLQRRRKIGWTLYGLAGIEKGDREASERFRDRNYQFFGAPVGIFFTIDERLEIGSWLDYGCFLQNIMIAARARGLHSCAQAAFASVHLAVRKVLPIPDGEVVVCGMSLGYIDDTDPTNDLRTDRAPVSEFASFHGD